MEIQTSVPHRNIYEIDGATEQIDAAIEIYFTTENYSAIHTLAAAAYNVLRDLAKHAGRPNPAVKSYFIETLKPEERKRASNFINSHENFLKHADRDPNGQLMLSPELTELMLIDACRLLSEASISESIPRQIFKIWVGHLRKDLPENDPDHRLYDNVLSIYRAMSKREFWVTSKKHLTNKDR